MKKIGKILSALILTFLFSVNVHAVSITTNSTAGTLDTASRQVTNTGTFEVTGVDQGDTFKAYKILDTFYNNTTNAITYEFTSDFAAFLSSTNGATAPAVDYSSLTVAQYQALTGGDTTNGNVAQNNALDTLLSAYAAYVKAHNTTGTSMTTAANGNSYKASATVPAGAYMALPTSTNRVYAVMADNVEFTAENNVWTLNDASIVAKVSDPSIDKVFDTNDGETASFAFGEDHTYVITANVPTYPSKATNKTLTITDTLATGLDYIGLSTVHVYDGQTELTVNTTTGAVTDSGSHNVGTVTISGRTMTISLNADYLNSTTVTVEYDAELNSNATLGSTGNLNTVKLTYSNDPYGSGTHDTPDETTLAKTYGIKIFKRDSVTSNPLQGAVFTIYSDSAKTQVVDTITSQADGYAVKDGLASGTYYVVETSSPAGYRANNTTYTIVINENQTYTIENVDNVEMGLLPSTGGIGTYLYIAIGAAFVVCAIALVYGYSRKNKKDDKNER